MNKQREIKFRAWVKESKSMMSNKKLLDYGYFLNPIGNVCYQLDESIIEEVDEYILMQYTSLKDKNGVEIYEGDIIKDWEGIDIYEIVWNKQWACFELNRLTHKNDTGMDAMDEAPFHFEVIGNIYENKELLK